MKAVCVNTERKLEVREIPAPNDVPSGHLLIDIDSSAINHGDKAFLANAAAAGAMLGGRQYDVWGASAAGVVRAAGQGVPAEIVGRKVAVYRSIQRSEHAIGLWSEQALVPRVCCVVLPDTLDLREYSGSLVNVMTAHAFLEQAVSEGHKAVIVTAGTSATGLAMAALARLRNLPAIFLTRSSAGAARLQSQGIEHALATSDEGFDRTFSELAARLNATAVFEGVGGELTTRIAPLLPMNAEIHIYGFLGAAAPITIASFVIMAKNLVVRRFSNFMSATVADPEKLAAALTYLESIIADPLFRTRIGKEFTVDEIEAAMAYETKPGAKAILVPRRA